MLAVDSGRSFQMLDSLFKQSELLFGRAERYLEFRVGVIHGQRLFKFLDGYPGPLGIVLKPPSRSLVQHVKRV